MGTVTAFTAERSLEIENTSIVDGNVVGDNLILVRRDSVEIDAGNVRGPVGPAGPPGGLGEAPIDGTVYGRKDGAWAGLSTDFALGIVGIAQSLTAQGSITAVQDLAGASVTVTLPAGRKIKISGRASVYSTENNDSFVGYIKEGATILGTWYETTHPVSGRLMNQNGFCIIEPSVGEHTYRLTLERTAGTGNANMVPVSYKPIIIMVEDVGPA